jgi:sulfhydrogenase subunit alpha
MTRLVVDPLTRVEGHGRVELLLKDGRLVDVVVRLLESPRLFERLVVGRRYDEIPDLVCRICAICSAVHKLTALRALESAMGVTVPPLAEKIRELLLLGGHIQSHALHLFCLIMPDLYGVQDLLVLLGQGNPLAKSGLELKAFGNQIQETVGGRVIHPVNPVFGGVNYRPEAGVVESLAKENLKWLRDWPKMAESLCALDNYPDAQSALGFAIATGKPDSFALEGVALWYELDGCVGGSEYASLLGEVARSDSHAMDAAGSSGPFLTGALARARLAAKRGVSAVLPDKRLGIHGNNFAQINEVSWALRRISVLCKEITISASSEPLRADSMPPHGGVGTAVSEAPRGLLVHHYVVDEWGMIASADIVTPTAINQRVIKDQILADLAGETDHDRLREVSQRIVRAYDPCISCAVHLLEI